MTKRSISIVLPKTNQTKKEDPAEKWHKSLLVLFEGYLLYHQSINQPINQWMNQWINESINESMNQSINQCIHEICSRKVYSHISYIQMYFFQLHVDLNGEFLNFHFRWSLKNGCSTIVTLNDSWLWILWTVFIHTLFLGSTLECAFSRYMYPLVI